MLNRKALALLAALIYMLSSISGAAAEVLLPQALVEIADEAFFGNASLTEAVIPEGARRIGALAFAGCINLTSVSVPSSVTEIGDDAFAGCPGLTVVCQSDSYAAEWCALNGIACQPATLTAYINQEWLDRLGLTAPTTVDELIAVVEGVRNWDPNGNGAADEIGMAAASANDFFVAFQTMDPAYEKERVMLLLAAGELSSWTESDTPFTENALIVVSSSLPAEYADEYEVLTRGSAPVVTPSPSPTAVPSDPDTLTAYINQEWLDRLGLTAPTTVAELIAVVEGVQNWDPNGNGAADEIGMAAASANDFFVAFQTMDPAYEKEKVMLLLAAGELSSWTESDTPFTENALIVVSSSLPAEYADEYEVLKP